MDRKVKRIGIFDSGIGGINVLKELIKKYPNNEYIFYGDTKNLPYGSKSKEELFLLASNAIDFLLSKDVDIIIIACGTISSTCVDDLRKKYNIPLYDIITPTLDFIKESSYQNIGVIATERTIKSNIFAIDNKKILMKATPSFVPIIENNEIEIRKEEIKNELKDFQKCDALVLGCTHYPMLKKIIEEELKIRTIDMGKCLTDKILLSNEKKQSIELYFTLVSVNLVLNINKILNNDYQIFTI